MGLSTEILVLLLHYTHYNDPERKMIPRKKKFCEKGKAIAGHGVNKSKKEENEEIDYTLTNTIPQITTVKMSFLFTQ